MRRQPRPQATDEATSEGASAGWRLPQSLFSVHPGRLSYILHPRAVHPCRSSLREEAGNIVGGNRAFANDAPTRDVIAQIDDGRCDIPRRLAAIDDNVKAALELVAHLLRAGTLRSPAEIRRSSSDRDGRGRHHGQRTL